MDELIVDKKQVFETLVIDHHVRLRAFVRSLGVDPDWVDDIAQESFLTAYREYDSYDPSRDFGKWLRGIAANIVRNEIRKTARRQRILHNDLSEILLNRHDTMHHSSEPLAIACVRDCLAELAPTSRAIVLGRYRDGHTSSELATRLELSAANIRQMLVRIRRQLKRCVERRTLRGA